MKRILRSSRHRKDALEQALGDWRAADRRPEKLSVPTRERILEAATREGNRQVRFDLPAPLFLPARRFALAALLPLVLLSVALGYFLVPAGPGEAPGAPRLMATRLGDEVVFVIANGDRPHRVTKASDPRGFDSGEPVAVEQGVFRDHVDSGANLVFYRID
jgi:hypothetical protein